MNAPTADVLRLLPLNNARNAMAFQPDDPW
jgi:hypothetical protein